MSKVNGILRDWAKNTDAIIKQELQKQGVGVSEDLLRSIAYQVSGSTYSLSFQEYGRFRDMGVGRPRIESSSGNNTAYKERKKARWYSKTVYKRIYGSLIKQIVAGYREELIRNTKGEIKTRLI